MFTHLRLHTEFSVVDSTNRIDDVIQAAAQDNQAALAITDYNNLFGAIKFYKAARSAGVKPIIGADVLVQGSLQEPTRALLLVQNHQGYLNLCELLTRAWMQNVVKAQAVIQWAWLEELNSGLIALSGAQTGAVGVALQQGDVSKASELALSWAALFTHRFYIELQRAGRPGDEPYVAAAAELAARLGLPVVATHPVQYLQADDYEAHEARVCIAEGEILGNPKRERKFTRQQYFPTMYEMQERFADLPHALVNSVEIAKRCNLTFELGKPRLPDYPTPNGMPAPEYFRFAAHEGLKQRMARQSDVDMEPYLERLEFELETILKMGFAGYFLIVGDFINWAKNNGCPVGPGRGSGAGSLVAYALGITDLDPLHYKLLFERFLNPERVSMPDFDIDFCQANRDRVIDYVKSKYGKDAVSQIATFGTMAARAAIRDVGRVLDFAYGFCDGISKLIPNKPGQHVTIASALASEPVLAERLEKEEDVRTLLELAQKLEGMTRNIGMHAGGVLIAPSKLTDFCPLYQQPGSTAAISQYDKDDVEAIGLVKFDFLGLATLTILESAKALIRQRHAGQENFSFEDIPLDDAATYQLFAQGKTEAVFQFESRGMQGMLRDARPTRLEDLIAMNALYRPGPMDLIPTYIARKAGREEVEYPDPRVEPILSETYGIMIYQEQVMQMAQILGGYSLGGADLLRRAMGKKKPEEMAQHRLTFRDGAAIQGINPRKADEIFDLMEKFAGYGFNKSHSAAYAVLAYQTAWLKTHYPAEFYCANMTIELDNTDKLKILYEDALKLNMRFEPPDINRGHYAFEPVSDTVIRYGLGAVKGTGQQAIESIMKARQEGGPFKSLFDFCVRVDRSKVNKRAMEALIKAGAFDSLELNRAALMASLEQAVNFADVQLANAHQIDLFADPDLQAASSSQEPALAVTNPWGVKERLTLEKTALGFYLSGHLFDEVEREIRHIVKRPIDALTESREPQLVAAIVSDFRVINSQRGKLALFKLDDKSASIEASMDEAALNTYREFLQEDACVVVQGKVQPDRFSGGLRFMVQNVWDLPTARCRFGKYLHLTVTTPHIDIARLVKEFPPKREISEQGELLRGLPIRLTVRRPHASAQIALGEQMTFFPSDAALARFMAQGEPGTARVVYE